MATRTKVLVVDSDLDTLSKIYLALVHRNYKAEASDKASEILERLKRLKPALIILGPKEYSQISAQLKIPAVVVGLTEELSKLVPVAESVFLQKPFTVDALMKAIESMII